MGIPAFYRWLLERYPKSVVNAADLTPTVVNGITVPIDATLPNPNGDEFDNLYLDMNGIIHPCFHPEGLAAPETYDQVFKAVFKYIDRIFSIVRPRKLLFMAIDGVAPRAKMNQQRARRFRAAKDAAEEVSNTGRVRESDETEWEDFSTEKLDSNVITPGTKFMELLSSALQYYVRLKMNVDSGWQGIKVILSDASVPGEGEHKIMSYIRLQRNLPGFDPNTRHCLYGLDADLIMLALATHEVHFSILREDIRKDKPRDRGHNRRNDKQRQQAGRHSKKGGEFSDNLENLISEQKFQFLRVWVLRNYLGYELQIPYRTVKLDLERLIDDFVFMCLFVGNDFLPHVPSLEISEGAIDLLMNVYKKEFVNMGGYLTNSGQVNLERVGHFIQAIGSYENAVFRKRMQAQKDWEIHSQRSTLNLAVKKNQDKSNHVQAKALFVTDKVKLGEEGWKERYYVEKFEIPAAEDHVKIQKDAVLKYVEGICWVMHYYYEGVCSWQWFYPYHYAPFASDFHDLDQLEIHFTIGKPFKPFDQLMGVLPAASAQALPLSYRKLMSDPLSPILDFYPSDFELDVNGKRHAWQAVCKLPFIEESRLLSEIANVEDTLTVEEKKRNSLGLDMLFVYASHPLASKILPFCARNKDNPELPKGKVKWKIHPEFSHGMNGFIYISEKPECPVEIYSPVEDMGVIADNKVISVFYEVPCFHPHVPRPPEGVIMPRKIIFEDGVQSQPILWHEKTALAENRYSRRHMPRNSVSGCHLARLAHQLVLKNCPPKQQVNGDGSNDSLSRSKQQRVNGDGSNDSLSGSKQQRVNGDGSNDSLSGSKNRKRTSSTERKRRKKAREALNGDGSYDSLSGSKQPQVNGDGSNDSLSGSKQQQGNGDGSNDSLSGSRKHPQANGDGSSDSLSGSKKRKHPSSAERKRRKKERESINGDGSNESDSGSKMQQVSGDGSSDNHSEKKQPEVNGDGSNDSLSGSKQPQVNGDSSNDSLSRSKMQQVNGDGINDSLSGSKQPRVNGDGINDSLSGSKQPRVNGDGINDSLSGSKQPQVNGDGSDDSLNGSKKKHPSGTERKRRKKGREAMNGDGSNESDSGSKLQQLNGDGSNDSLSGRKMQQANGDGYNDSLSGSKQQANGDGNNDSLSGSKKKCPSSTERKRRKKEREAMKGDGSNESDSGSKQPQVNGGGSNDSHSGSMKQQVNGDGSNDSLSGSKKQQVNGDGSNDSNDSLSGSRKQQVNGDGNNDSFSRSKKRNRPSSTERKRRKKEREAMNGDGSNESDSGSKKQQVSGDGSNDNHSGDKKPLVNGDGDNDSLSGSKQQQVNGDDNNESLSGSKKRKRPSRNEKRRRKKEREAMNGDGSDDITTVEARSRK